MLTYEPTVQEFAEGSAVIEAIIALRMEETLGFRSIALGLMACAMRACEEAGLDPLEMLAAVKRSRERVRARTKAGVVS